MRITITCLLGALLLCGALSLAQAPVVNIDPKGHPELADAQKAIVEAFQRIEIAQKANKDQLGGHAESAKQLLTRASQELKLAEETADKKLPPGKR